MDGDRGAQWDSVAFRRTLAILLVQGCILPAAGQSGCIVPRPAGWMEGGVRGERQRKREKYTFVYLSLLNEGRRRGLAEVVALGPSAGLKTQERERTTFWLFTGKNEADDVTSRYHKTQFPREEERRGEERRGGEGRERRGEERRGGERRHSGILQARAGQGTALVMELMPFGGGSGSEGWQVGGTVQLDRCVGPSLSVYPSIYTLPSDCIPSLCKKGGDKKEIERLCQRSFSCSPPPPSLPFSVPSIPYVPVTALTDRQTDKWGDIMVRTERRRKSEEGACLPVCPPVPTQYSRASGTEEGVEERGRGLSGQSVYTPHPPTRNMIIVCKWWQRRKTWEKKKKGAEVGVQTVGCLLAFSGHPPPHTIPPSRALFVTPPSLPPPTFNTATSPHSAGVH
ncbi:unnamed protein product [Pleuronectes platessa]|uniref:Uncharacterized protein n=1 Tax=Pleuronectes platessa TaxID=8262 RepID=A0A9N7VB59_PLEPL|nr:unnamed protein product [Pleuronectes platessa]